MVTIPGQLEAMNRFQALLICFALISSHEAAFKSDRAAIVLGVGNIFLLCVCVH